MNAVDYTKNLRRVALLSWVGSLLLFLLLGWLHLVPLDEFTPLLALAIGSVPIVFFMRKNTARCDVCGGPMEISSGYPRIVYRCTKCHAEEDTGINSD